MVEKKLDKPKNDQKPREEGFELENQFILRLPEEPAKTLREIIQSVNSNLKDRMTIQLDNDLRYGEVRIDHWKLYSKIVDLPTIIECLKTIDKKSFYKSSDICQMMICKTEQHDLDNNELPNKGKKKDPNKVDKKFLWAHGITPPCKNVRKRRFRKTLKKKNIEAPEIEKEVKRLLRIDNDAVKVEFEIINEDLEKHLTEEPAKNTTDADEEYHSSIDHTKSMQDTSLSKNRSMESDEDDVSAPVTTITGVGEHDIFGEEVSSTDDDDDAPRHASSRMQEIDESSRLSADDTRMSDFFMAGNDAGTITLNADGEPITEYEKTMFGNSKIEDIYDNSKHGNSNFPTTSVAQSPSLQTTVEYFPKSKPLLSENESSEDENTIIQDKDTLDKIAELQKECDHIKTLHSQKAQEILSIGNPTLRQRIQETLDTLAKQIIEKEMKIKEYKNLL